jgi:simple sugar transport system permease protein
MYSLGVPDKALLAGRAVLVLLVILLYSEQSRRIVNRLFVRR